ncbi:MAG: hypothetical protein ABR540_19645 [Acidimicrobiales bacterium]
MAKLFRDLQRTWERDGAGPDARAALARWAEAQPPLAAYTSPAALVAAAHHRDAEEAKALVEALTEKAATDAWAARTVLHALLPGLAAMSREHLDMVGPAREPFGDVDDLDHFVVSTAYERIAEVASEVPRYRLRTVLDSTWSRPRTHAEAHRRDHDRRVDVDDLPGGQPAPARSAAEELALILVDAVKRRVLRALTAPRGASGPAASRRCAPVLAGAAPRP